MELHIEALVYASIVDRFSQQFDNDLDQLESLDISSEDELSEKKSTKSFLEKTKNELKNEYESYDSDRTIELTM